MAPYDRADGGAWYTMLFEDFRDVFLDREMPVREGEHLHDGRGEVMPVFSGTEVEENVIL
jgi:hypothetical protein